MIKISRELYIKEELKNNIEEIKDEIKSSRVAEGLYYICVAENENDALDIFSSGEFKKKIVQEKERTIVGLAFTKMDAMKIVENMVEDYYKESCCLDNKISIRQYFLNK